MKILLIDDHALFRDGLKLLLARLAPDISVVDAGTCEEGFRLIDSVGSIDLALIDLNMPGMSGTAVARVPGSVPGSSLYQRMQIISPVILDDHCPRKIRSSRPFSE